MMRVPVLALSFLGFFWASGQAACPPLMPHEKLPDDTMPTEHLLHEPMVHNQLRLEPMQTDHMQKIPMDLAQLDHLPPLKQPQMRPAEGFSNAIQNDAGCSSTSTSIRLPQK